MEWICSFVSRTLPRDSIIGDRHGDIRDLRYTQFLGPPISQNRWKRRRSHLKRQDRQSGLLDWALAQLHWLYRYYAQRQRSCDFKHSKESSTWCEVDPCYHFYWADVPSLGVVRSNEALTSSYPLQDSHFHSGWVLLGDWNQRSHATTLYLPFQKARFNPSGHSMRASSQTGIDLSVSHN